MGHNFLDYANDRALSGDIWVAFQCLVNLFCYLAKISFLLVNFLGVFIKGPPADIFKYVYKFFEILRVG